MKELDDLSLIDLAQNGDREAEQLLLFRYTQCVESIANSLQPNISDKDDLTQEGLLGLARAIKSFDTQKNASFKTYASHCIRNAMLDHIKLGQNKTSNIILESDLDDSNINHINNIKTSDPTPEEHLIRKEEDELFYDDLKEILNTNEISVINLYLSAMSYREIADSLGIPVKQVDNTLVQAKKKLKKMLEKLK